MSLISIIIPYYGKWELTHARLLDLYRYAPDNCEVVLINDASSQSDCETGAGWWQKNSKKHTIRYYKNRENLGFGGSHNMGARLAKGDIFIFLSNDVIMSGDVITPIERILTSNPKTLACGKIIYWAAGWNEFVVNGKGFVIPYAEGWLLATTRDGWKELGGFDPRYGKYDYEDVDLSMTALDLGYDISATTNPPVKHLGGATVSTVTKDRQAHTIANRQVFIEKWQDRFEDIFQKLGQTKNEE